MRRYATGGICAAIGGVALSLALGMSAAQAQPGGSYLETCTNVRAFGDRIIADCRREDGGRDRTVLNDVDDCVGGIDNQDGQLVCNRGGEYGWRAPQEPWEDYGGPAWHPGWYPPQSLGYWDWDSTY